MTEKAKPWVEDGFASDRKPLWDFMFWFYAPFKNAVILSLLLSASSAKSAL